MSRREAFEAEARAICEMPRQMERLVRARLEAAGAPAAHTEREVRRLLSPAEMRNYGSAVLADLAGRSGGLRLYRLDVPVERRTVRLFMIQVVERRAAGVSEADIMALLLEEMGLGEEPPPQARPEPQPQPKAAPQPEPQPEPEPAPVPEPESGPGPEPDPDLAHVTEAGTEDVQ